MFSVENIFLLTSNTNRIQLKKGDVKITVDVFTRTFPVCAGDVVSVRKVPAFSKSESTSANIIISYRIIHSGPNVIGSSYGLLIDINEAGVISILDNADQGTIFGIEFIKQEGSGKRIRR